MLILQATGVAFQRRDNDSLQEERFYNFDLWHNNKKKANTVFVS